MAVTIVQVKRRAVQGVTRPFLCAGDDGKWYWAKGTAAGKGALCREWLGGRIAQALGLPVPPFVQATVPPALVQHSALADVGDLGSGLVFASEHAEGAEDFTLANMRHVPVDVRRTILAFDWLIQNQDRTLGERGGNVNLLYLPVASEIRVIDHNIAFAADFDPVRFQQDHVFRADMDGLPEGFALEFLGRARDIAARLGDYFAELPEEWTEDAVLSPDFSLGRIRAIVERLAGARDLFLGITL